MIGRSSHAGQWGVRILCALALLFVGFAHKPPVAAAHGLPVALYALPDGSLPDLCLPSEDGKGAHGGKAFSSGCEACRLSASILLPAPADMAGAPMRREAGILLPARAQALHRRLFPPNALPRGPPSGLTA